MMILLSPAKSLNETRPIPNFELTQPRLVRQSQDLMKVLKSLNADAVAGLMHLSPALAQLNHERFQQWKPQFTEDDSRPALWYFDGDVYQGMDLSAWKKADFLRAQEQVRILSGLYGVLRPFDLMRAYRLEMGTKLAVGKHKNLYQYWGKQLTDLLNADLEETGASMVVNLASNEYASAVQMKALKRPVIHPVFLDEKNGNYRIISFFAKKARGLMADFIVREKISKSKDLLGFSAQGYRYQAEKSKPEQPVFCRAEEDRT